MRIAAVQCPAVFDDPVAAGDVILHHLRWAATNAVDLVVFPESFLLGHTYDAATICSRARTATLSALSILCGRVAAFPSTLIVGSFDYADPLIHNTAFVIEAGDIVGRYAKAHPNEPGVTAGTDFPIFARSGVRYGINVCNDTNYPDAADSLVRQGTELLVYPLNTMLPPDTAERWRDKSVANLIQRARQTGCWIVSSDVVGTTAGQAISYGCTAIVAPDGTMVACVPEFAADIAVHDIPARSPAR